MALQYQNFGAAPQAAAPNYQNADGSFNWGSLISPAIGAAGSAISANQLTNAQQGMINQQNQTYNQVAGIYQPQYQLGTGADASLASALGIGGAAPNYAAFQNTPGYQFALQQGSQAINRQAAASGNAYNSGTLGAIGAYDTGLANQTYQSYVQNLLSTAGLGNSAAGGMASARYNTGANVGQGIANIGAANASGVQGATQAFAGPAGSLLSSFLKGGSGNNPNASGVAGTNTGTDANGGYFDAYGNYIGPQGSTFNQGNSTGDLGTSFDNSTIDYSQSSGALGGPSAAGGEAAGQVASGAQSTNNASYAGYSASAPGSQNASGVSIGNAIGDVGAGLSAYTGFKQGGTVGNLSGAVNTARLANNLGAFGSTGSTVGAGLNGVGAGLGLYTGLKQGGVLGDANAALSAAQLAGTAANIYAGGATAATAAGGTTAALSGAGAFAAGAALPLGLFGAQYALFNKQSQYTPSQQFMDLQGQLARLQAGPQTAETANNIQTVQALMSLWNPQTQNFDIPYDVGGPSQRQGGNQL